MAQAQRFLRLPEVLHRVGAAKSTWYWWMNKGNAPKPVHVNGTVCWLESDIDAFMDAAVQRAREPQTAA